MDTRGRVKSSCQEDVGGRLEQRTQLAGPSWEELAERIGVRGDGPMKLRNGVADTGGEVWRIMGLAWALCCGGRRRYSVAMLPP